MTPVTVVCVCAIQESVCMYGFCPQVTAPTTFTWGCISPGLRGALTIGATGITTRTASVKILVHRALTMTTDQVSPYTFSTAQYFSLFCSFCSCVLSLQATLCLCNRTIKKMLGMLKLYAAEYCTEGRRLTYLPNDFACLVVYMRCSVTRC